MDPEFDASLDRRISDLVAGEGQSEAGESEKQLATYEHLAAEIARVMTEESPRLSAAVQVRNLALLRARAAQKRTARRIDLAWLLHAAPRWVQIAAVAIVVVILANGITVASASSLPGSPLYPVKRLAEQGNVFLAPTAGERARIWMDLASRRLDEVQRLLVFQPSVDPGTLDAIDESILHALTEIAGTRGTERITLLQQIIQLAVREQGVLDELSLQASADDRARFQETARLLADVAHIAGAAQSNPGLPLLTPTRTETATLSPTVEATPAVTSTSIPTLSPSPVPPIKPPVPEPTATTAAAAGPQAPDSAPSPQGGQTTNGEPTDTPEANKTNNPEPQATESPDREKTDSPQPHKTQPPDPQKTESPDREKTGAPEHQNTQPPD